MQGSGGGGREAELRSALEAAQEELGQKNALLAGLRGELRKYTQMAARLEGQVGRWAGGCGPGAGAVGLERGGWATWGKSRGVAR